MVVIGSGSWASVSISTRLSPAQALRVPSRTPAASLTPALSVPKAAGVAPAAPPPLVRRPPRIPATGAYLGIDANFGSQSTGDQVVAFEHSMGAPVGIASFYVAFLQVPSLAQMHSVLRTGAVPMVNMKCGAPDGTVTAGQWDVRLRKLAADLRSFGGPVFFRWFWEMNLLKVQSHAMCLGRQGAGGYIAAFHHIWTIFHKEGATNVAFVWAPSDAQHVNDAEDTRYYPGSAYVDWIGADLYDRQQINKTFGHEFDAFYRYWHAQAPTKPIMISETGAIGGDQPVWLKQITSCLTRKVVMTRETPYTQVKALVYVDAIDKFNYVLKNGSAGHSVFAGMLHLKYFDVRA
jgi:hypothetical protein